MATTSLEWRIAKTLLFLKIQLEKDLGRTPTFDPRTTLNNKYSVLPDILPPAGTDTDLKYYGIGIRGARNIDQGFRRVPEEVLNTNMDLYLPLPLRVVPKDDDLPPAERLLYRIRRELDIDGTIYVLYYLKVLEQVGDEVIFTIKNSQGNEVPYTIDYGNLTPTPPQAPNPGTVEDTANEINATASVRAVINGYEVNEAVSVLYNGDPSYGMISELGFYTGQDFTSSFTDSTGVSVPYTESIMTQLAIHYTWLGSGMNEPSYVKRFNLRFGTTDLVLTGV